MPYLKRTLNLTVAEVLSAEEALEKGYSKLIIESSEPGGPAFEFRNVTSAGEELPPNHAAPEKKGSTKK